MSEDKPVLVNIPRWDPNEPVFVKKECPQCGFDRQFKTSEIVFNQRIGLAYSVDEIVEVLNAMRAWEDKARELIELYESIVSPIEKLCREYNIPLRDVAATLEEYIGRDNR